jgi:hypothetical protein
MSNPEFKRNLWLSFSLHRLIAMPALLALTFLAILFSEEKNISSRLYEASIALFIFVVWLWGARNANASIVDELRDKTWDQQRMSAINPWTMTWGKLFGSTSFNWYGGLMCLIVIAISGFNAGKPDVIVTLLSLCAVGVLVHAVLIAINLHSSQTVGRIVERGGLGWLVIIFFLFLMPSVFYSSGSTEQLLWWNMKMDHANFWLFSALLFAACTTIAAWRVTSNALQVRTLPWAWPALALVLTAYISGFNQDTNKIQTFAIIGLFISVTLTYTALFSEQNTLQLWRKLRVLQAKQDWRYWLESLPMWPTTMLLSFIFAIVIQLTATDSIPKQLGINSSLQSFTLVLMLLRDTCILLFFTLAPNSKRALGATILYLLVLNLLLPFLASIAGLDSVRYFLLPFDTERAPWSGILIMTIHAVLAIALVEWRLRNSNKP